MSEFKRITQKTLDNIEWESATLDMSFMDDYPKEVEALLDAQLAQDKADQKEERRALGELLNKIYDYELEFRAAVEALKRGELPEGIKGDG
jgi:hypothetical protein